MLAVAWLCSASYSVLAHPCSDVDRSLTESQKALLAPVAESHMKTQFDARLFTLIMVQRNDERGMCRAGG